MADIGVFIAGFLREHRLSRGALAERLGYKSKTTIDRLINGNARQDSIIRFKEAMEEAFSLSEIEQAALSDAVQISIHGIERHLANREIWRFIQGETYSPPINGIRIVDSDCGQRVDLVERYAPAREVKLTLVNGQYVIGLFDLIEKLLQREGTTAEHFIYVNDDDARTIRTVSSLMPVFYNKHYMGYARRKRQGEEDARDCGLHESDLLIAFWEDADRTRRTDAIVFSDPETGILTEIPAIDEDLLLLFGFDKRRYYPIKRNYFDKTAFEDYIKYSEDYAALEKDRAIWKIKPDICVDQIPAWILRKAVEEGPVPHEPGFQETLDALEDVYRKRFKNTYSKYKHAYSVYKRSAMYRFAMTGRTTDHFWMMRPYTPEERVVILKELLDQQKNNPYIHMYFLKDDAALRDVEIACYEDEGMLILEADTDYNLKQGHTEFMVTHQEMLNLYRDFFMNVLIKEYVHTESETCGYLRYLISEIGRLRSDP